MSHSEESAGSTSQEAHHESSRHVDDAAYVGDIPSHYHRGIGPFLFEPFARHTAERVKALSPRQLLETACGTGIVTRQLRQAMPEDATLIASDLNEPMLAIARNTVGATGQVQFVQSDMIRLDFPDAHFDALVCQFGLMFVPDKLAAVREARRCLKKGGHYLLTTWAPLARNPVVACAQDALASTFPAHPPGYLARAPFGYGDPDVLEELLKLGGFQDVRVDVVEKVSTAPNADDLARGLVEGYPLVDEIRALEPGGVPRAVAAVAAAIGAKFGTAPVRGRIAALVALAVA